MIDIIVTTHGRLDLTMACVNAIFENTKSPFHLIIMDDSTDLTPTYCEQLKKDKENVTYIHSDNNYKEGNQIINLGLKQGDSKYVAVVNNSVRVEPDWETLAIQLMDDNPKLGAVGFKCLFPNGLIESAGINLVGFTPCDLGRDEAGHRRSIVYECDAAQWACVLLRREAVGTLEEGIYNGFRGWDDIDNCFVLRRNGWQVWYNGLGSCYHTPRITRGQGNNEKQIQQTNHENSIIFYKRWGLWEKVRQNVRAEWEIAKEMEAKKWDSIRGDK